MAKKEAAPSEEELKIVYLDILNGYTPIKTDYNEGYIKHLNVYDSIDTDKCYKNSFDKARGMGLPTRREQLDYLASEGLWDRSQETEMAQLKTYTDNLQATKSKLFLDSEIQRVRKLIEENSKKLNEIINRRNQLVGFVAEAYAEKRSNEYFMHQVLFKDKEYKKLLYSPEEFDELNDQELTSIYQAYSSRSKLLNHLNIKRISLCTFFTNFFYLCDDNIYNFYGRPVVQLTHNQNELYTYGRYFKNLAQDAKTPAPMQIRKDPDALIEFYEGSKNAEEAMEKMSKGKGAQGQGASTIVGATKKDLEKLGYKQNSSQTINLADEAAKRGGTMDMDDFIEIHHQ
jgi:chorismate mutase